MTIAREEIFGPVLSIIAYQDEEDAVRIANDTDYGLSGYVSGEASHAQAVALSCAPGMFTLTGQALILPPLSVAISSLATVGSGVLKDSKNSLKPRPSWAQLRVISTALEIVHATLGKL